MRGRILRPMTTYPLSPEDRAIQDRARQFVDEELIPWEQHAEEHGGADPPEDKQRHHDLGDRARVLRR